MSASPLLLLADVAGARDFNEWRFVFQAPWGKLGLAVATAAAIAIVVLAVIGTREERRPGRRALLGLLRAGSAAAAWILFAQPAIQLENVTRLPNRVAVLVDRSASMTLREREGEPSRGARAAKTIETGAPAFEAWRKLHHVDFYTFGNPGSGERPRAAPNTATAAPEAAVEIEAATEEVLRRDAASTGEATRIREALAAVRARYEGHDLGGVVIVSDGIDNGGLGAAWTAPGTRGKEGGGFQPSGLDAEARDFLRGLDAPVHTIWTGRAGLADIAVARVLADDFAFARNVVKVEAVVRVLGGDRWRGQHLPVTLRRDGVPVKTVDVTLDPDKPEQKIAFEFTPDRVGKYLYEVSAPVQDGEAIAENNGRVFMLKVIRDKIRVLLVAGRPSWDERFLRGLLKHNPNVDLISFFILRTPSDIESVSPDEMSLIPFPTEELFLEQLKSFDLVFLQNFNYGPYGIGSYLEEIKDYVVQGGGLAMIGGDLAFTSGGYAHTPVADILPVELLEPGAEDTLLNKDEFALRLTPEGRVHPITALRLDADENAARWAALPPLAGLNLVARAKPNATVLAAHPTLKTFDGKPMPVLVAGEYGKGRSLALTTDSSWRWGFGMAGLPDTDDARTRSYQRFWENAIRWLVHDPELRLLRLESEHPEWRRGEKIRLRVRAFDAEYKPAKGLDVSVAVSRVAGSAGPAQPITSKSVRTDEGGEADVELDPLPPGGYRAVARAQIGSGGSGSAMAAAHQDDDLFVVRGAGRELEDPEAREELLRAVADATGGRYLGEDPGEGALTDLPFQKPEVIRINKHRDVELWSTWITLVAAAVLLSLEWLLRRRNGLL